MERGDGTHNLCEGVPEDDDLVEGLDGRQAANLKDLGDVVAYSFLIRCAFVVVEQHNGGGEDFGMFLHGTPRFLCR